MFRTNEEEEFVTCPFDKMHSVVAFRMHRHILKCKKNYRGPPLEMCIYNATHWVPSGTMADHLKECADNIQFHQTSHVQINKNENMLE